MSCSNAGVRFSGQALSLRRARRSVCSPPGRNPGSCPRPRWSPTGSKRSAMAHDAWSSRITLPSGPKRSLTLAGDWRSRTGRTNRRGASWRTRCVSSLPGSRSRTADWPCTAPVFCWTAAPTCSSGRPARARARRCDSARRLPRSETISLSCFPTAKDGLLRRYRSTIPNGSRMYRRGGRSPWLGSGACTRPPRRA